MMLPVGVWPSCNITKRRGARAYALVLASLCGRRMGRLQNEPQASGSLGEARVPGLVMLYASMHCCCTRGPNSNPPSSHELSRIQALAEEHQAEWVGIRRHLHAHPELSFEEHQTMAFVSATLTSWGVDHQPCDGTGIVAHVRGKKRNLDMVCGPTWMPFHHGTNAVDYASTTRRHAACGHDVHTTSLLGALHPAAPGRLVGTVRDQPGEECIPGGAKAWSPPGY